MRPTTSSVQTRVWIFVIVTAIMALLMLQKIDWRSFSATESQRGDQPPPVQLGADETSVITQTRLRGRPIFPAMKEGAIVTDESPFHYRKGLGLLREYESIYADQTVEIIPVDLKNFNLSTLQWWQAAAITDWYMRTPPKYNCSDRVMFGNWGVCQDKVFKVEAPCLVYSFGIANDFSFDDAMGNIGCEVHSFDPSINKQDTKRGERKYFYNTGLHGYSYDRFEARRDGYVRKQQFWKVRTLKDIRKELGHSERAIDVLKIDIEGTEWTVLDNLIESGQLSSVRQLVLEFHFFTRFPERDRYVDILKTYTKLRTELGFKEFHVNPHPHTYRKYAYNIQSDVEFVNTLFVTPRSRT